MNLKMLERRVIVSSLPIMIGIVLLCMHSVAATESIETSQPPNLIPLLPTPTTVSLNRDTKIISFESEIDYIESEIKPIESTISSTESRISSIEKNASFIDSNITSITENVDFIGKVKQDVTSITIEAKSYRKFATDTKEYLGKIKKYVIETRQYITSPQQDINAIKQHVDTESKYITSLKDEIISAKSNLASLEQSVNLLERNTSAFKKNVTPVEWDLISMEPDICSIEENLRSMDENLRLFKGTVSLERPSRPRYWSDTMQKKEIDGVKQNISEKRSRITIIKQYISDVRQYVRSENLNLDTVKQYINGELPYIRTLKGDIKNLLNDTDFCKKNLQYAINLEEQDQKIMIERKRENQRYWEEESRKRLEAQSRLEPIFNGAAFRSVTDKAIMESMNDPDSYKFDKQTVAFEYNCAVVTVYFRGKNGFGGVIRNVMRFKFDFSGKLLEAKSVDN